MASFRSIVLSCSNADRMDVLDLTCYDIGCLLEVHELSTEDDGDPLYQVLECDTFVRKKPQCFGMDGQKGNPLHN